KQSDRAALSAMSAHFISASIASSFGPACAEAATSNTAIETTTRTIMSALRSARIFESFAQNAKGRPSSDARQGVGIGVSGVGRVDPRYVALVIEHEFHDAIVGFHDKAIRPHLHQWKTAGRRFPPQLPLIEQNLAGIAVRPAIGSGVARQRRRIRR